MQQAASNRTASRDRNRGGSFSVVSLPPLGQAVMDAITEGVVVFDSSGDVIYANPQAKRALDGLDHLAGERPEQLRRRLVSLGARLVTLPDQAEAAFLPVAENGKEKTLAQREQQAILETLQATKGKLAETARQLGISRTTLWRRLKSYGLERFRHSD